jgi:hypothetical protein
MFLALVACSSSIKPTAVTALPASRPVAVDNTRKERRRNVPPEVYLRTYLTLFGGLTPLEAQKRAKGRDLFDGWDDYLSLLGLPDYKIDIPRAAETNALMMATFERLGVALCDRAAERDLGKKAPPVAERPVFPFNAPAELDRDGFAVRFAFLHLEFLGYPLALAPAERLDRFYTLYKDVVARHAAVKSGFVISPQQAGWAAVCQGLVRHPELELY